MQGLEYENKLHFLCVSRIKNTFSKFKMSQFYSLFDNLRKCIFFLIEYEK